MNSVGADRHQGGAFVRAKGRAVRGRGADPIKRGEVELVGDDEAGVAEDDEVQAKSMGRVILDRGAELHRQRSARANRNQITVEKWRIKWIGILIADECCRRSQRPGWIRKSGVNAAAGGISGYEICILRVEGGDDKQAGQRQRGQTNIEHSADLSICLPGRKAG